MKWKPGNQLWHYFHLPEIDKPFSRQAFLNLGDDLLVFKKDGVVIKSYQSIEDISVFCLSYDFEVNQWMYWLHDDGDLSWIPEDGCDWEFYLLNLPMMDFVHNSSGILEVESE